MTARLSNPNLRQASQLVYDYPSAKSFLRGSSDRKLAHNTWVLDRSHTASTMRHGHAIAVRYHNTDIVTYFEDGTIIVNNGGYMTVTTNKRLNLFLPPGFRVMQKNYQMYLLAPHDRKLPFDGYVEFNADNLRRAGKVVQVDHRREIMDVADSIGLEPFVPRREKERRRGNPGSSFMERQVFQNDGWVIETDDGDFASPDFNAPDIDSYRDAIGDGRRHTVGDIYGEVLAVHYLPKKTWWGRYSAPGYLDATSYVYGDSRREVEDALADLYGDGGEDDE